MRAADRIARSAALFEQIGGAQKVPRDAPTGLVHDAEIGAALLSPPVASAREELRSSLVVLDDAATLEVERSEANARGHRAAVAPFAETLRRATELVPGAL